jgi:hypothetical protein
VPREHRRFEIRKELENRKEIVAGILGGLLLVPLSVFYDVVGRNTFASFAAFAVATTICLGVALFGVNWVFRRIEVQRLRREFPPDQE